MAVFSESSSKVASPSKAKAFYNLPDITHISKDSSAISFMDPGVNPAKPDQAPNGKLCRMQPWKAFANEPEIQPFAAEQGGAGSVLRLKTEDEHGLGG